MPSVVVSAVSPDHHKVDLIRAFRSVDDGPLEPALARWRDIVAGRPVRFELASDGEADRFLAAVTRAGATAERSG